MPLVRPVTLIGDAGPVAVMPPALQVTVKSMMALPPFEPGAVKAMLAAPLPDVAAPMVGAPGTTAFTLNACVTVAAGRKAALPAWLALMEQAPVVTKLNTPPLVMVQTPVVVEVKVSVKPDVAVAVNVGEVPKFCAPGLLKVMVWVPWGVTDTAPDAGLEPTRLRALTEQLYVVPLVRPVTLIGDAGPVALMPPTLQVTV